jgi:glycosyltransferase involved in cell wall biosynthesis
MPIFSIIIPTYNRSQQLISALNSVLNQLSSDSELVVVDDGSTDGTSRLISEINDKRIKYNYQENAGVSKARNYGAIISSGNYLIFLDSDDNMEPGYLDEMRNCFSGNDILFIGALIFSDGKFKKTVLPSKPYGKPSETGLFLAGTFAVKREIFIESGGYDEFLTYAENTELSFRIKSKINNRFFIDKFLLRINQPVHRISSSPKNIYTSVSRIISIHQSLFKANPALYSLYLNNLGVSCLRLGYQTEARGHFSYSIILTPFNLKPYLRFILTFLPKKLITKYIYA